MGLANRVGAVIGPDGGYGPYVEIGRATRDNIEHVLPADWDWEGRRVLDFGCGAGRALRHFLPEARGGTGEFWGSDIDAPSIAWLQANFWPPLHALVNQDAPPLEVPERSLRPSSTPCRSSHTSRTSGAHG